MNEALKNEIQVESFSDFDIYIVESWKDTGKVTNKTYVICNGFKRDQYITNIARLINNGHENCNPIIDNYEEIELLSDNIQGNFNVGIRIAAEQEPKFELYNSRFGIGYKNIIPFYEAQIKNTENVDVKILY